MHAERPVTRVEGDQIAISVALHSDAGHDLSPLSIRLSIDDADLLDPTATPHLPVLVAAATLLGEDLRVDGPVDAAARDAATRIAESIAAAWGARCPRLEVAEVFDAPLRAGGTGLLFSGGVRSWSTLLDLLDEPPGERVTHLVGVVHDAASDPTHPRPPLDAHRTAAGARGLHPVTVATTAGALLGPLRSDADTAALVLLSAGLSVARGLSRLVLGTAAALGATAPVGEGTDLLTTASTPSTGLVGGDPARGHLERVAQVSRGPGARASLLVCRESVRPGCGRCAECQLTMAALLVAGDADPSAGFGHGPDPACVRSLAPTAATVRDAVGLLDTLPAETEELRRAWADVIDGALGQEPARRWGDGAPPGLAGPGVPERVAAALRATTGRPDGPAERPLGWRPGAVPLRPAFADHVRVRDAATRRPPASRPRPWGIVEHHVRDGRRDGRQAQLARLAHRHHGPGALYLPGILWAPEQEPVLDRQAVSALLATVRVRLWWREDGDLDPLRTVESIEAGCLPVQVMPDGIAQDLRVQLPARLRPCVVGQDDLSRLMLTPDAVAMALGEVVEHLLSGSAERDLLAGAHGA